MGRFNDCVFATRLLLDTAGSARNTPRPATDATTKPKGLEWKYQGTGANGDPRIRFGDGCAGIPGFIRTPWLSSALAGT
jgi:hypothetical protein